MLAARSVGVPRRAILVSHILPNAISPVIVQGTLALATAIIDVAGLGFLGLGPQDPATPEWGTMLTEVDRYLQTRAAARDLPGHRDRHLGARLQPDRRRPARGARPEAARTVSDASRCSRSRTCSVRVLDARAAPSTPSTASRSTIAAGRDARHRRRVGLRQERHVARAARHPAARRPRHGRHARCSRAGTCSGSPTGSCATIRGREIAMIFQDPMTSLNPVLTIGRQIREALETHFGLEPEGGERARASSCSTRSGIPSAAGAARATTRTSSRAACASAR